MSLRAGSARPTLRGMRALPTAPSCLTPVACLTAAVALALGVAPATGAAPDRPMVNAMDLNKVGLPIVWRGRLVNYVFVALRLRLPPGRDGQALRAREPYFRDALVRAGHRTPFVDPSDLSRVDERAVDAAMLREARRIAGPGAVVAVEMLSQQPRRRLGRPEAAPPAGRPITP